MSYWLVFIAGVVVGWLIADHAPIWLEKAVAIAVLSTVMFMVFIGIIAVLNAR